MFIVPKKKKTLKVQMPRTDLCGFVQGTTEIQLVRVAQHTDIEAESGKPQEVVPREISYLVMSYEPSPFGRKGQGPSARLLRHCSRCGWKSHAFPFYDQVYVMMIIYEEELWPPILVIFFSLLLSFVSLSFSEALLASELRIREPPEGRVRVYPREQIRPLNWLYKGSM